MKWWSAFLKMWRITFMVVSCVDIAFHLFGTTLVLNKDYAAMADRKPATPFLDYWTLALIAQFCRFSVLLLIFAFILCGSFIESVDTPDARSTDLNNESVQTALQNKKKEVLEFLSTIKCNYGGAV